MNVGMLNRTEEIDQTYNEYWEASEEVDICMTGTCYTCGGVGHPQRLCPSEKGKGKGKGKGGGKGLGKGAGKYGGKAFAKGTFPGNCNKCGKYGHRAIECRGQAKPANSVEEEEWTEPATVIGSVWAMCVEKITTTPTHNPYNPLADDEEKEEENIQSCPPGYETLKKDEK